MTISIKMTIIGNRGSFRDFWSVSRVCFYNLQNKKINKITAKKYCTNTGSRVRNYLLKLFQTILPFVWGVLRGSHIFTLLAPAHCFFLITSFFFSCLMCKWNNWINNEKQSWAFRHFLLKKKRCNGIFLSSPV